VEHNKFLMAIDIGTTSVKCLVIDENGKIIATSSHSYPIYNPAPSWVEQQPEDWWDAVISSIKDCLQAVDAKAIAGISFSGHMSALVLVDEKGTPLHPSILIADTRSSQQTSYLRTHYMKQFLESTGNEPIDAFTVSKLMWVKEEKPDVLNKTTKFLFPKDYVRLQLTSKMGTDPTDAGNSLLYHLQKADWNWELIHELDLPPSIFPDLIGTTEIFGYVTKQAAALTGLQEGTPVITGGADMACSHIGTGAIQEETMVITLSTSGQVVTSIPAPHEQGIGKVTFHPGASANSMYTMGTIFTGGLGVEWGYKFLFNKQEMKPVDYDELNRLTERMKDYPPGSNGLLFLPFLVGSGTPYFDPKDRASWIGLTLNQDKALLLHSILEGITFNLLENINVMKAMEIPMKNVFLGAGGSKNPVWCQMIADVLGIDVALLTNRDGSALGAAIIAGVGVGLFPSIEKAVSSLIRTDAPIFYQPDNHQTYKKLFEGYQDVYQSLNRYQKIYS